MASTVMFKGRKFHSCSMVVVMPMVTSTNRPAYVKDGEENYVTFGRLRPDAKAPGADVFATDYFWDVEGNEEKERVYATPIESKGYSLTNLMYATDGYMYLALNGKVYRAPIPRKDT